jgi:serine kinase of HPr protein (carbohydrate metabolism regulator)
MSTPLPDTIHGTAVRLGPTGVLLRGPSGAGKSLLALALLERWALRGLTAGLVSDDRVALEVEDGAIVMAAPAPLAGLIELRGRGIIARPYQGPAQLDLVIDLVDALVRMPEETAFRTELLGVTLAAAPVPMGRIVGLEHQLLLIEAATTALSARE